MTQTRQPLITYSTGLWALSLLLCSCEQQPSPKAQAVLLVHWPNTPGDYSREYATLADCDRATVAIYANGESEFKIEAELAAKHHIAPVAPPVPIPICIPT